MIHPIPVFLLGQRDADVPEETSWLTAAELERLETFRVPKRRDDWRLGRWTAKRAIEASGLLPDGASARIVAAPDGAPEVDAPGGAGCAISISHAGGRSVCAVASRDIALGCDIEAIVPRDAAFVADYFTANERALVEDAPDAERPLLVTLLWSAKESALKALREGLRLDTRSVSVCLPDARVPGPWQPLAVHFHAGGRLFHGWWLRDGDFVVTVVALPRPERPAWQGFDGGES